MAVGPARHTPNATQVSRSHTTYNHSACGPDKPMRYASTTLHCHVGAFVSRTSEHPCLQMAHDSSLDAMRVTARRLLKNAIGLGVAVEAVSPCPSCPLHPSPHEKTVPQDALHMVCCPPHRTSTMLFSSNAWDWWVGVMGERRL